MKINSLSDMMKSLHVSVVHWTRYQMDRSIILIGDLSVNIKENGYGRKQLVDTAIIIIIIIII